MAKDQLAYKREKFYFGLIVAASIIIYLVALVSIIGILFLGAFLLFMWMLHMYSIVSIRKNGVKLNENQFPEFYEQAQQLKTKMGLHEMPSIFVIESGGFLNAFATKFGTKNMVVLYSDVFSLIEEGAHDEVTFILAHEFAHLKRRHVTYSWLLIPGLSIPFLSSAYSRACEFTCDTYGAYYSNNSVAAQNALTILAVGPKLYTKVNQAEYLDQIGSERGFFNWLQEITASHPNLPRRIDYIKWFFSDNYARRDNHSSMQVIIGLVAFFVFGASLIGGSVVLSKSMDKLIDEIEKEEYLASYGYEYDEANKLFDAVILNDLEAILNHSANKEFLNDTTIDGFTPLHIAVTEENTEAVEILLDAGANFNTVDSLGYSPLADAIYYENLDIIKLLLDNGATGIINSPSVLQALEDATNQEVIDLVNSYK